MSARRTGRAKKESMKATNGTQLDEGRIYELREFKQRVNSLAMGRVSSVSAALRIAAAAEDQLLREWGVRTKDPSA